MRKIHLVYFPGANQFLRSFNRVKKFSTRHGRVNFLRLPCVLMQLRRTKLAVRLFLRNHSFQALAPELGSEERASFRTSSIHRQSRGNDPGFSQTMVKNNQAVVKSKVTVRQIQIVCRTPRQSRLEKGFEIVSPETKTPAEGKRKIDLITKFIT